MHTQDLPHLLQGPGVCRAALTSTTFVNAVTTARMPVRAIDLATRMPCWILQSWREPSVIPVTRADGRNNQPPCSVDMNVTTSPGCSTASSIPLSSQSQSLISTKIPGRLRLPKLSSTVKLLAPSAHAGSNCAAPQPAHSHAGAFNKQLSALREKVVSQPGYQPPNGPLQHVHTRHWRRYSTVHPPTGCLTLPTPLHPPGDHWQRPHCRADPVRAS